MVVFSTIIFYEIFDKYTSLSIMKTKTNPQAACAKNSVGEKSVTTKSRKKRSSQPKCARKNRLAKNKQAKVLDVKSICTYHLVQITLGRVEKLLKKISSRPSGKVSTAKHTAAKLVNKSTKEGMKVVSKASTAAAPTPLLQSNVETTPK